MKTDTQNQTLCIWLFFKSHRTMKNVKGNCIQNNNRFICIYQNKTSGGLLIDKMQHEQKNKPFHYKLFSFQFWQKNSKALFSDIR